MSNHPKIEDAPGLIWRSHGRGWEARWQCRTDLAAKGFKPKSMQLWAGVEPSEKDTAYIQDNCRRLQDEMLLFGRGGLPAIVATRPFTGTLQSLIDCYQTDPDSPYQGNRYHTRRWRDGKLRQIGEAHGEEPLAEIRGRTLKAWHKEWGHDGERLATGSAFIGQLRALFSFGATMLEDPECERLCGAMHLMRFKGTKAREVSITAEQANAIRAKAREFESPSIALGQAFQFEGTLRQKDVIGEWVPLSEPGPPSDVIQGNMKSIRGILWQEIDANLILRHVTSKKQKEVVIDLKLAPMVIDELARMAGCAPALLTRDMLPASGPIIVSDRYGLPWSGNEYRRKWRKIADACGLPKSVKNMDSRSGAISEAISAGASLEMVRHAATHSDISQTADYDRTQATSTASVMKLRVANRNKPQTE